MVDVKINKKQRNLLLKSEITKDYDWLCTLLHENEKVELDLVPDLFKDEYSNVLPFILKQAGEEWRGNEELLNPIEDMGPKKGNWKRCVLCNTPNRYIYYIKNRLNSIKLNVGGDCVEEFVNLDELQMGKSKSQLLKGARRVRRQAEANKNINGIDRVIESWDRIAEKYDIMIPNSIERPFIEDCTKMTELYHGFLDEKYSDKVFKEIRVLLSKYEIHIQSMKNYQTEYNDHKYVVTKRMIRWLQERKKHKTLESLKEAGMVTSDNIQDIHETNFIRRIFEDIVKLIEQMNAEVENANYEEGYIDISPNIYNGIIKFKCSFEKFIYHFGPNLFENGRFAALTLNNLLRVCDISENTSKAFFVEAINDKFKGTQLRMSVPDEHFLKNEVDIINIYTNKVLIMDIRKFIVSAKHLLTENNENKIIGLQDYFLNLKDRRYTISELADIRSDSGDISKMFR